MKFIKKYQMFTEEVTIDTPTAPVKTVSTEKEDILEASEVDVIDRFAARNKGVVPAEKMKHINNSAYISETGKTKQQIAKDLFDSQTGEKEYSDKDYFAAVDAVVDGVKFIMEYYNQLVEKMIYSREKYDWVVVCRKLAAAYKVVHEMGSAPSCDVAEAYYQSHTKQK
jgi:hypothetical protein